MNIQNKIAKRTGQLRFSGGSMRGMKKQPKCILCKLPVYKNDFESVVGYYKWIRCGLCQNCQNKILLD